MLIFFCKILRIKTQIIKLSEQSLISGKKSDLILNICKNYNATEYLSGINGKDYLNLNKFKDSNIKVKFQNFNHPIYKQLNHENFTKNLSVVDYIMNNENIMDVYK